MHGYDRVARVIRYLDEHRGEQPALETLAQHVGLSRFHLHRLFSAWAGITPKHFLQCLTLAHARQLLREGQSVLAAALESGLSGPGRLHDLCVNLEAASPGELKSGAAGWTIDAGFAPTPFGICLVGNGPRGICHLSFAQSEDREMGSAAVRENWPLARLRWDDAGAARIAARLFERPAGRHPGFPLRAFVRGTRFRVRVWRALLEVPEGALVSYRDLAAALGQPSAARAVGSALGRNPLAYLIPCHRVIRETGAFGTYRWGHVRKRAMLAWESSAHFSEHSCASSPALGSRARRSRGSAPARTGEHRQERDSRA